MLKAKFFAGPTSYWGFGIAFDSWDRSFQVSFIHWFIAVEFWIKDAV